MMMQPLFWAKNQQPLIPQAQGITILTIFLILAKALREYFKHKYIQ